MLRVTLSLAVTIGAFVTPIIVRSPLSVELRGGEAVLETLPREEAPGLFSILPPSVDFTCFGGRCESLQKILMFSSFVLVSLFQSNSLIDMTGRTPRLCRCDEESASFRSFDLLRLCRLVESLRL